MKPERSRPYLRISNDAPYPALHAVDEPLDDDADYIDCFGNKDDIARSLMLLCELWGLPQCGASEFREVASPCMYHTLHSCMAPCSKKADVNQYKAAITEVKMLLNGLEVSKLSELRNDLTQAVAELDFELAAVLKRQIESLEHLQNKGQKRYHLPDSGRALVLIRPYREQSFSAFLIYDGSAVARFDFNSDSTHEQQSAAIIAALNTATTLPDSDWIPNCLIEVAADKQFLLLSSDSEIASAEITKALLKWTNK
jgi:excinuclease ABC subunit C